MSLKLPRKKLDSPLAKYNSSGQLFCVLCNTPVKNEIYWTGHVNGKSHKENLTTLKSKSPSSSASPSAPKPQPQHQSLKRPAPSVSTSSPDPTFLVPTAPPPQKQPKLDNNNISKLEYVKQVETELARIQEEEERNSQQKTTSSDNSSTPDQEDTEEPRETEHSTELPQGFFDDPKEDARARGQKFRDPQDVEWDKFVKEIASEDIKSNEIVGVEQEKSAVERELDHIEEQMAQWQRVIDLEKRATEYSSRIRSRSATTASTTSTATATSLSSMEVDEEADDDEDYEEELDWRNKKMTIDKRN